MWYALTVSYGTNVTVPHSYSLQECRGPVFSKPQILIKAKVIIITSLSL